MRARLLLAALLALGLGQAWADGSVTVSSAWARASPPHAASAAVYLTITDNGGADRLLAASTPVAAAARLHESRMVGAVMQMRPVEALPVAPGQKIVLAPGGYHLMLTGLKAPLRVGERFPLTLQFDKAGAVTTTVTVEKLGAGAPAMEMKGMDMPGMSMPPG